ncbi:MAG: preprotein translocase subunit Sec61beta [Thermoproteota archaeon]
MAKLKKRRKEEDKEKDTSPTVFTAAGLLAFSEEEALFNIKPLHAVVVTVAFIFTVLILSLI